MKTIKVIIITCAIIIVSFFTCNSVGATVNLDISENDYVDYINSHPLNDNDLQIFNTIHAQQQYQIGVNDAVLFCVAPYGSSVTRYYYINNYILNNGSFISCNINNGILALEAPVNSSVTVYYYEVYNSGSYSWKGIFRNRVFPDLSSLNVSSSNLIRYNNFLNISAPQIPDYEVDAGYIGVPISVDPEAFTQWLLETEKYKELPGTFEKAYIKGLTNVFVYNGLNTIPFFNALNNYLHILDKPNVPQIFSEELRDKYYSLLQEYKVAHIETIYPNHNHPHNRVNIETQTNDDNTTLITDTPEDTVDTSILRDILRAIISMNTNISYQCDTLKMRLDNIFYDCNQILDKLDSLGGGSDQNIDLAQLWIYNPSEVATIQQDFNIHLQDEIDSKILLADNFNNKPYMPEKLLSQQDSVTLTMQLPGTLSVDNEMSGYTITSSEYSVSSADFPKLDNFIKKFRTFAGVLMVVGYAVHMRFRIAALIRGEA